MRIPRVPSGVWLVLLGLAGLAFCFNFVFTGVLNGKDGLSKRAKMDIHSIENAVMTYKTTRTEWPVSLVILTERQPDGGPALLKESAFTDPWGRPYHYDLQQRHLKTGVPLIWSDGPHPDDPTGKITNWQP